MSEAARLGGTAVTGTKNIPVFPYLYANTAGTPFPTSDLQAELFDGPWATGTMREYWEEVSYGLFSVGGSVADWYSVSNDDTYYEGNSNGLRTTGSTAKTDELVLEVIGGWDASIDFSQYDNDGPDGVPNSGDDDGYVDFIILASPEYGGECTSISDNENMWSHRSYLTDWGKPTYETNDAAATNPYGFTNIHINGYMIWAGLGCGGSMGGIGTVCHELGHALDIVDMTGLMDLYDTSLQSQGLGYWGLMGYGNWNTQSHPAHLCAWAKERLGWLTYERVTSASTICLDPVETSPVALQLWQDGVESPEYFVVENRQAIGFDDGVKGTGLVIYHIDEDKYDAKAATNAVNADESHKAIDVECPDATTSGHVDDADDLDLAESDGGNRGDSGDVWGPSTKTTFDKSSVPDSRSYSGVLTDVSVSGIAAGTGEQVCATISVGAATTSDLCIHDCDTDDCSEVSPCEEWWGSTDLWIDNNDDGVDDLPSEDVDNHLWFRVHNEGVNAVAGVTVELYYGDPAMGQKWPSTGTLIGSKELPIMDAGETKEDYVIFRYLDPPPDIEHYCIGAVVRHSLDPQNSEYPPEDDNVAQVNHQILVARANEGTSSVAAGATSGVGLCNGTFAKTSRIMLLNPKQGPEMVRVRLGTPPDFSDWNLPEGWYVVANPDTMAEFELAPGNQLPLTFLVGSQTAVEGQTAHLPLTLTGTPLGGGPEEILGGVILDYRIDCSDPVEPLNGIAEWITVPPDNVVGPNVRLSWDAVTVNQAGGPETVKRYEIYRSDTAGSPEALVASVALDAEPSLPGVQWYDTLKEDCSVVYIYRVRAVDGADGLGAFSSPIYLFCSIVSPATLPQTTFVDGTIRGTNCTSIPCWPGIRGTDLQLDPDPEIAAVAIDDNWNTPAGDSLTVKLLDSSGGSAGGINWRNGFDKTVARGRVISRINPAYKSAYDVPRMIFRIYDPATRSWSPFDSTELDADDARISGGTTEVVGSLFRADWPPRDKVAAGASLPGGFTIGSFRWGAPVRSQYSNLAFLPRGCRLQYYFKSVDSTGNAAYVFSVTPPGSPALNVPESVDLPLLPGGSVQAPDIMEFGVLPGVYPVGSAASLVAGRSDTPILNLDGGYRQFVAGTDPQVQALTALGVRSDRYRLIPILGAGHNIGGHERSGVPPAFATNFFPNMDEYPIVDSLAAWYRILIESQSSSPSSVFEEQDARLIAAWFARPTMLPDGSTGADGGDRCILSTGDNFFDALLTSGGPERLNLAHTVFGVDTALPAWSGAASTPYPTIDDRFAAPTSGPGLAAIGSFMYPVDGTPLTPSTFDALTKVPSLTAIGAAIYPNQELAGIAVMTERDLVGDRDRSKALGYAQSLEFVRQEGIPPEADNFPHSGVLNRMRILYKFLTSCRGPRSASMADTGSCWPCPTDTLSGLTAQGSVGNWKVLPGFRSTTYGPLYPIQDHLTATGIVLALSPVTPPSNTLSQNRPNPFNPNTVIPYRILISGRVQIHVYDVTGRLIRTLVDDVKTSGDHTARWDGSTDGGLAASSGVYFYRITYPDGSKSSKKMTLLR